MLLTRKLKNDKKIVLSAVKQNASILQHISNQVN